MDPGKAPEEAEFVGTGAFRVDRSRAARKLQRFQALGGFNPFLLWIRCANACGAAGIHLRQQVCWSEIRFDGTPFTSTELADALGAFFAEEGEASQQARLLSLGFIQAFNGLPRSITVRSGQGRDRMRLVLAPAQAVLSPDEGVRDVQQALERDESGETDTSIQLEWAAVDHERSLGLRLSPEDCYRLCAMSRASIAMEDDLIVDPSEDPPGEVRFERDGARGVLARAPTPRFRSGLVELSSFGVSVCAVQMDPALPLRAWIDDERLTLNASLDGVVRDERFRRALTLVRSNGRRLLRGG